ncbi:MAG: molybdopterin converting factor subunit 1 [Betaproteobacteria bacterium]
MSVTVLYFARLREQLGQASEAIDLPATVASVGALRAHLAGRGGRWQEAFAQARNIRVAVNQDMLPQGAADATAIKSGDEVAFFPPVTGG